MNEIKKVLITEEQLKARNVELGRQITEDFKGKELLAICILRGSYIFFSDLTREIELPLEVAFMHAASYFDGTESSGRVNLPDHNMLSVEGKDVLLVEDIVDSGRTLAALKATLLKKGVNSLRIVTLLDKPDRRVVDVDVDYSGFVVPDEFVVGYGLDYDQRFRNLKFVGILNEEVYQ